MSTPLRAGIMQLPPDGTPHNAWNGIPGSADTVLFANNDINNTWYLGFVNTIATGAPNTIPLPPSGTVTLSAARTIYAVAATGTTPLVIIPGGGAYFQGLTQGQGQLVLPSVRSPNFITGISGWIIRKDGSAEFNNLIIRGTFNGNNFIFNSAGFFVYSGTPAAGNLIAVMAGASGTDQFGNFYRRGITDQENVFGTSTNIDGALQQFLSATGVRISISPNAQLAYNGDGQLGNLRASIAPNNGTDAFGNNFQPAITTYIGGNAQGYAQLIAASLNLKFQSAQFSPAQLQTQAQGQAIFSPGQTISTDVSPSTQWLSRGANGGISAIKTVNADVFTLPAGSGPGIDGETFHTVSLGAGLTGQLSGGIGIRVQKMPWGAVWLDVEVSAAATGTFTCGNLPDATYYPNASRHFSIPSNNAAAQNVRIFVPTSGALQIIAGGAAGAWAGGASVMYPLN